MQETGFRIFLEVLNLTGQLLSEPFVVGIEKRHQLPGSAGHASVARPRRSPVLLPNIANSAGEFRERFDERVTVGRAVVYDDDFEVIEGLGENRSQGARDVVGGVEYRNYDADVRHSLAGTQRSFIGFAATTWNPIWLRSSCPPARCESCCVRP